MIVLTFPVIKWGPEFVSSTVGHQFKCKPRTGLAKLDVGIYWFLQRCLCEIGTLSTPKGSSLKIKRRHFMLQSAKAAASMWIGQCELGSEITDLHARSGGLAESWWALTVLSWYLLTKTQSRLLLLTKGSQAAELWMLPLCHQGGNFMQQMTSPFFSLTLILERWTLFSRMLPAKWHYGSGRSGAGSR